MKTLWAGCSSSSPSPFGEPMVNSPPGTCTMTVSLKKTCSKKPLRLAAAAAAGLSRRAAAAAAAAGGGSWPRRVFALSAARAGRRPGWLRRRRAGGDLARSRADVRGAWPPAFRAGAAAGAGTRRLAAAGAAALRPLMRMTAATAASTTTSAASSRSGRLPRRAGEGKTVASPAASSCVCSRLRRGFPDGGPAGPGGQAGLQVGQQLAAGAVARVGVAGQRLADDRFQPGRQAPC